MQMIASRLKNNNAQEIEPVRTQEKTVRVCIAFVSLSYTIVLLSMSTEWPIHTMPQLYESEMKVMHARVDFVFCVQ